ncbi:hypothetical protein NWF34_07645 [Gordonia sp. GONU]|uniref:hypothetical protein n=1 Tax=Gordonia sp. GONU TaxID=2972949 RepID=UPI0021AC279B|nr:hypothetical protein [Gordonia sp. GONU]MCR8896832.1 hypothetical protein [Gordonia sp. GONU]
MAAPDLTAYEELTVDQQIGPDDTDAVQGWPLMFPDGSAPLSPDSTTVKSSDWSGFRDPNRVIYVDWVVDVHRVESTLVAETARLRAENAVDRIAPDWLNDGIGRDLIVLPFVDRAYFRVLSRAQRLALSDTITLPLVFESADKLRHVEHAAALRVEVENAGAPDIFADVHDLWLNTEHWRPLRETVELLLATEDWVEAVVAVNLVLEPLVGQFLRSEYLLPVAERNNDPFTPLIVNAWTADTRRAATWTRELTDHLGADPTHGPANRDLLRRWISEWTERARAAVDALTVLLVDAPGGGVDPERAWQNVIAESDGAITIAWTLPASGGHR